MKERSDLNIPFLVSFVPLLLYFSVPGLLSLFYSAFPPPLAFLFCSPCALLSYFFYDLLVVNSALLFCPSTVLFFFSLSVPLLSCSSILLLICLPFIFCSAAVPLFPLLISSSSPLSALFSYPSYPFSPAFLSLVFSFRGLLSLFLISIFCSFSILL